MSAAIENRIMRLERAMLVQPHCRDSLYIVHASYRDPGEFIGVYGIDVHRLAGESVDDFVERLEQHVRVTRGRALPFVGLARYANDDD